jgi:hypothetical protein
MPRLSEVNEELDRERYKREEFDLIPHYALL